TTRWAIGMDLPSEHNNLRRSKPIVAGLFECKSSEERVVYKRLNSTETLIQRTTMEAPQQRYVLHWARRSQEDDQLLHQRCRWSGSAGRDDSGDSHGAG